MGGAVQRPNAIRQVALAAGPDLDATLAYWRDILLVPTHARFDPPGIAFVMIGGVRLFFSATNKPATTYLDIADIDSFCAGITVKGVDIAIPAELVHTDMAGQFGPAGESEWMAFVKDPAGNTIALVERKPS
ncbi:hypothetical protein SAMN04488498_105132 [Mesorhizobium albiziae]|uniref:VOC domain-containing protein n=1 Tax=Neomesorhizobium albiziae TaxID=335020 RepID=A0A1I3YRV9_9HYPH|nr:glyoxalase [Mesorhizobium albiziae]GLS33317.1 glyoxalase [Mesorhizobium albiziae]SFK34598.1 hypothetical protein SAMN04488498_105132 [Mesorhizobium albiziae]